MAERIVQEESLATVADAIRAKSGTTDPLSFPDGFKTAIETIQAGGGGGVEGYQIVSGSYTPAETVTSSVLVHKTNSLGIQSKAKAALSASAFFSFLVIPVPNDTKSIQYPTAAVQSFAVGKSAHCSLKSASSGSSSTLGNNLYVEKLGTNKYAICASILCSATYPLVAGQTYVWALLVPSDIAI